MAQSTDIVLSDQLGAPFRAELNQILSALGTNNSGNSEPLNTYQFMKWVDTSNATYYYIKERNHDNTAWVTLFRYTVATKIMEAVSNGVVLSQTNIASEIHASSSKTTPVDADEIGLIDSASTFTLKKLTWANLKATLKTYFDTLYQVILVSGTNIKTINSNSILGSGDLVVSAADATSSVKGIDYKGLLYEAVVTGSAVTSIDFPLLDINTHKSYRVEIEINSTGGVSNNYLFINGDTTLTNYYGQRIISNGTSITSNRDNAPLVGNLGNGTSTITNIYISKVNGIAIIEASSSYLNNSTIQSISTIINKTATVTNITQLTFTSSVASAIGVGTKIRIYRGDV